MDIPLPPMLGPSGMWYRKRARSSALTRTIVWAATRVDYEPSLLQWFAPGIIGGGPVLALIVIFAVDGVSRRCLSCFQVETGAQLHCKHLTGHRSSICIYQQGRSYHEKAAWMETNRSRTLPSLARFGPSSKG
ncbi:hypothetical protein BD310DRAFT_314416 [Dichomitus squalens]|uniref:Uncharacterized protein n=1 Tax=Dichomitus squalens TaxID=114155 RepID=A0A4Q9PAU3_9APHY|nr:hypothetical protein BD310DRAFT_314416 [Dichomitus squalens]